MSRILELLDFAALEDIALPMAPEEIIALEDAGHVVDLRTGYVVRHGASTRVEATVLGEATTVVLARDDDTYLGNHFL